ncbi:MAG: DUF2062 domain-containing protein [Verrucomicrobiota bacterium]
MMKKLRIKVLEHLRNVVSWVKKLLGEGLTSRRLAMGLALSLTIAVFPVFLLPAAVCGLLAVILRLNQPVMQAVNYVAGPVQILLFIPFMRLGEHVFDLQAFPLSLRALRGFLDEGILHTFYKLSSAIGRAAAGWAIFAPFGLVLFYLIFFPLLRRVSGFRKHAASERLL